MEPLREDQIKDAFQKVKGDMDFLNSELLSLKEDIMAIKEEMVKICEIMEKIALDMVEKKKETPKTPSQSYPAHQQINQTFPIQNPTQNKTLDPKNSLNKSFSTGNEGVPTDRQTDRQTDNMPQNYSKRPLFLHYEARKNSIEDAAQILDSLDSLKKEIRIKFKQLTDQEILVFSTIYQLEEEQKPVDYKILAQKLGLTESSIRDYIGRLLKKGIPVEKKKINNKQIQLGISQSLKKIASLSTILQLRDI